MSTMMKAADDADIWSKVLLEQGYCVIPDVLPGETLHALNTDLDDHFESTPFCDGKFYGERTKRFGTLLTRSARTAELIQSALILPIAERILGPFCDNIQLNLGQAISVHPGALPQFPHRDQDLWGGEKGHIEYLVNVMWPLTDYAASNGATRVWPNSHGARAHDPQPASLPETVEMEPGSALLFLGSTLHGAGGNTSMAVRRGIIISYCLGWLKPYENQWLAYPPDVARRFAPDLAALVGYRQHRPNLGNVEGRCPSELLRGSPRHRPAAQDALRPDQAAEVARFAAAQERP